MPPDDSLGFLSRDRKHRTTTDDRASERTGSRRPGCGGVAGAVPAGGVAPRMWTSARSALPGLVGAGVGCAVRSAEGCLGTSEIETAMSSSPRTRANSEMTSNTAEELLRDLGALLKERSLSAQQDAAQSSSEDRGYKLGFLMAYHEVISLLKQQAEAFGIDVQLLCLHDIDPDRDLL